MYPEDNTATQDYIPEKWWHRLMKVCLYGSTAFVVAIIGLMQLEVARYYTYSYSFEHQYENARGDENDCAVYQYSKDVSCGELGNSKKFVERYLILNGDKKTKVLDRRMQDALELAFKEGFTDFDLASYIIKTDNVRYKKQQHYDWDKSISGIGFAIFAGVIWFLICLLSYKLLLYIVHGHTWVKKEPPTTTI